MDRRFLFPAIAAVSSVHPGFAQMSDAEKALRARAEQFYQLEVAGDFRHAEAFVAEDTKDLYYKNGKPDISKFSIEKVEIKPDGEHAIVTVNITTMMKNPAIGVMPFTAPVPMTWKLDDGKWSWYQVQDGFIDSPFGKWYVGTPDKNSSSAAPPGMPVDPSKLGSLVTIDRNAVELAADGDTPANVTISNHMSGAIDVKVVSGAPAGLSISIDKEKLAPGQNAVVTFKAKSNARPTGKVHITAGPIQEFEIDVQTR